MLLSPSPPTSRLLAGSHLTGLGLTRSIGSARLADHLDHVLAFALARLNADDGGRVVVARSDRPGPYPRSERGMQDATSAVARHLLAKPHHAEDCCAFGRVVDLQ